MNIERLTTGSIRGMHDSIHRVASIDDQLPKGRKRYGVREYADWRETCDRLEAELTARRQSFIRFRW